VRLNVGGYSGVQTKVGVVLSSIYFSLLVGMAFVIVSEYFNTTKPFISQSIVPTDLPPPVSFYEDKLYPIIAFRYQVAVPLKKPEVDRFVNVEFNKVSMTRDEATSKIITTFKPMKTVACSDLVREGKLRTFEASTKADRESLLENGLCVDTEGEEVTLGQKTSKDPFYQLVILRVLPCSLPSGCATREELARVTFSLMIPKPIQDLSDKNNPVRYVTIAEEAMYISTAFTSRKTFNLIKTDIVDAAGFISSEKVARSYSAVTNVGFSSSDRNTSQLSCTQADIDSRSCIPYFIQNYATSPQKMVIKRQYKGMVETFSELGGMVDMLFMLFLFPYAIYNQRALKEKLVEAIFQMKKPSNNKVSRSTLEAQGVRPELSSGEPQDSSAKQYARLVEDIETCLDVVQIARELRKIGWVAKKLGLDPAALGPDPEPASLDDQIEQIGLPPRKFDTSNIDSPQTLFNKAGYSSVLKPKRHKTAKRNFSTILDQRSPKNFIISSPGTGQTHAQTAGIQNQQSAKAAQSNSKLLLKAVPTGGGELPQRSNEEGFF
jgi:hypothetical protein